MIRERTKRLTGRESSIGHRSERPIEPERAERLVDQWSVAWEVLEAAAQAIRSVRIGRAFHDAALLRSDGGADAGVLRLAEILDRRRVPIVALSCDAGGPLGRRATVVLSPGSPGPEALPPRSPSASAAAMLALGDALAACLGGKSWS